MASPRKDIANIIDNEQLVSKFKNKLFRDEYFKMIYGSLLLTMTPDVVVILALSMVTIRSGWPICAPGRRL